VVFTSIKPELCYRCKTFKKLCGLPYCPIQERLKVIVKTYTRVAYSRDLSSASPPSGVVGEYGYPKVKVYVGVSAHPCPDVRFLEDPPQWWERNLKLEDIIKLRSEMVNIVTNGRYNVSDVEKLYSREVSLIQVSTRPVDCEVKIEKIIDRNITFDLKLLPLSMRVIGDLKVTSNPSIDHRLEKAIQDHDLKAREAIVKLYDEGLDIYSIQRALSFGLLGARRFRKIVPTRWAITAVDRTVTMHLRKIVKKYDEIDQFEVYVIEYMNNRFTVIIMPGDLKIRWIEFWYPRAGMNHRSEEPVLSLEIVEDLKGDVETMDGGFEAARMGILEALYRRRRKGRVIIVREILPDYYVGIGNWHIREDMRRIFSMDPVLKTGSETELLKELSRVFKHRAVERTVMERVKRELSQRTILDLLW